MKPDSPFHENDITLRKPGNMSIKKLLIIKCGDTIPELAVRKGDFEDWIIAGAGLKSPEVLTINVEKDEPLPTAGELSGVIITGSHAMVTEHRPWSEKTAVWLASAVGKIPVLGICYGHQLLGYALGGKVADNPAGREMGMVDIRFSAAATEDALLGEFSSGIKAPVSHKQSLIELPPSAVHLASSTREPNQAFRHGDSAWGLQFHPEFDIDISNAYIDYCHDLLVDEGQIPGEIKKSCHDSDSGTAILQRFGEIIRA